MSSTRLTTFITEPKFTKAIKGFGISILTKVVADIEDFEFDWRNGMEDDQLYAQYNFKPLRDVQRPHYKLFQIRVGPNRKNLSYRAVVMFYERQLFARWVHAFKKEAMNEPQEIQLAVARADECWNKIKR